MKTPIFLDIKPYVLRELQYTDIVALHALYHCQEVAQWLPNSFTTGNILYTACLLKELMAQSQYPQGLMLAIVNEKNTLIGTCALEAFVSDHARYEIAFELHPDYHRKGIMRSAIKAMLHIAFEDFKANRLDAFTLTHNYASQAFLKQCGFTQEGVLKQFRHFRDAYHDIVILGLVRDDWYKS